MGEISKVVDIGLWGVDWKRFLAICWYWICTDWGKVICGIRQTIVFVHNVSFCKCQREFWFV